MSDEKKPNPSPACGTSACPKNEEPVPATKKLIAWVTALILGVQGSATYVGTKATTQEVGEWKTALAQMEATRERDFVRKSDQVVRDNRLEVKLDAVQTEVGSLTSRVAAVETILRERERRRQADTRNRNGDLSAWFHERGWRSN